MKDMTGKRFGRLLVVSIDSIRADQFGKRMSWWKCQCDCGTQTVARITALTTGDKKSCGCLQKEGASKRLKTHGMSGSRLFDVWTGMLQRCSYKHHVAWKNYGGRGIKVCERWKSFNNFFEDMGHGYRHGLTLERLNSDWNYEPGNVVWADRFQQNNHRKNNILLTHNDKTQTLAQWARELRLNNATLYTRYRTHGVSESMFRKVGEN